MSAVDEVASSLGNVNLADAAPAATPDSPQADPVSAIVAEGRRLYIGNLAYATTETELQEFFKGFLVESTSIPTNPHSNRPVGYAFVDLSTATEAQRAIQDLSGKEILNRKVSVQLARKPETAADKEKALASGGEGAGGADNRRRLSGRGRGRGRGRGARGGRGGIRGQVNGTAEETPSQPLADTTADATNSQNVADGSATISNARDMKPRTPRLPKQRGPPEDGIPSKNKVMVANLPYELSEEKLKELFADYNPSSAKIALRPIPRFMVKKLQARNEPRKGRGFGFVSLESEEMQQKAVAEMHGKEVDGREIAVKIAIDSPGKEDVTLEGTSAEPLKENGVAQSNDVASTTQ